MFISENTLDDILHRVFESLLESDTHIEATRGKNRELRGVLLELSNPRARLSQTESKGTIFSCLGETIWYLAGSNRLDFIQYYLSRYSENSDDGKTIYGAYGPRLLSRDGEINQIENITTLLRTRPTTRRAVIQLFDARDLLEQHKDIPCTCTIQFMLRNGKLDAFTCMRSNDAFLGLPHDIFAFTFIQEAIARALGCELGAYRHAIGSLHSYDEKEEGARKFLQEGWQSSEEMPPMPSGLPWTDINAFLKAEVAVRSGHDVKVKTLGLPDFWSDLIRLLQVFAAKDAKIIEAIKPEMTCKAYDSYIDKLAALRMKKL